MESAVKTHRWSLWLLGIWPYRDRFTEVRFVVSFALVTAIVIPQFLGLCAKTRTSERTIDCLCTLTPLVLNLLKLYTMRANREGLRACLDAMDQDWAHEWPADHAEEVFDVMQRNTRIAKLFNVTCNFLLYLTTFGYLTLPFTVNGPERRLPIDTVYVFDTYPSPNYELTYAAQCLSIMVAATTNFSIDTFFGLLVLHFCGQFEILGKHAEQYYGSEQHDDGSRECRGSCFCGACIVKRHEELVRFSGILEESFNVMLLFQILVNCLLFCFLGYGVMMNYEDNEAIGIATFLIYMLTMMFHLFLYSYVGEELMEKSQNIGRCAYKSSWYDLPPKVSKRLLIVMARSKMPLQITAGKFVPMSFETYTDILKTSAKYLSVLRAARESIKQVQESSDMGDFQ